MMKAHQYVRWPQNVPALLVGGFDIEDYGIRYAHVGPLVASTEHERRAWVFRLALGRMAKVSLKCRITP